jgi:hypothetical protein
LVVAVLVVVVVLVVEEEAGALRDRGCSVGGGDGGKERKELGSCPAFIGVGPGRPTFPGHPIVPKLRPLGTASRVARWWKRR